MLKELEVEETPIPKETVPPLSEYYYMRRKEDSLWRRDHTPGMMITPDEYVEKLGDYSPMEKLLVSVVFLGVGLGVGYVHSKIQREIGKVFR